jgi:hypothetical protein
VSPWLFEAVKGAENAASKVSIGKTMETTEKPLFFSEKLGFFTVIFGKNGLKIVLVIYFTIAQLHVIYRAGTLETIVDADDFGACNIPVYGVHQFIVQVHLPYPAVRLYPNLHVLAKIYAEDMDRSLRFARAVVIGKNESRYLIHSPLRTSGIANGRSLAQGYRYAALLANGPYPRCKGRF